MKYKIIDDLTFYQGQEITCDIEDIFIDDAKIQIEENGVFICQDKQEGYNPNNTLGYKYGWYIGNDSAFHDVDNIKFKNKAIVKDDILFIQGQSISCIINGTIINDAKIQIYDNNAFICQNLKAGASVNDTLGYKYSWAYCPYSSITDIKFNIFPSVTIEDYTFIHGQRFTAIKGGLELEGIVSLDGVHSVYLCQDKIIGAAANNLFGYKYSWAVEVSNIKNLFDLKLFDLNNKKSNSIDIIDDSKPSMLLKKSNIKEVVKYDDNKAINFNNNNSKIISVSESKLDYPTKPRIKEKRKRTRPIPRI